MNNTTTFAAVSTWINTNEAKALRGRLIAEGVYTKEQIKLSSYRWVDLKDHSKGYMCRVMAVKGIRSDLEVGEAGRSRKSKSLIVNKSTDTTAGNSSTESMTLHYYCRRNNVDETTTGTLSA